MRAPLLAALAFLPPAARLCGSSPPCDTNEGSCGAWDGPASEFEVGAREAEEAAALRVELLQKARLARRGNSAPAWPDLPIPGWPSSPAPGPPPSSSSTTTTSAVPSSDPSLTRASNVCILNKGGFRLSFELWDTETNQRVAATNPYAAETQDCRSIGDIPMVEDGHPIVTVVYIEAGATISLSPIIYDSDLNETTGSANLRCQGGTGNPTCLNNDVEVQHLPPPDLAAWAPVVYANEICLTNNGGFRLRFKLWNTAWNSLSSMSDHFDMGGSKCISGDFASDVTDGNPLVPIAYVQGAYSPFMFHSVLYRADASAANYVCSGTTGGYTCTLMGT